MRSVELLYYPGVNLLAGEAKALVVHPAPGEVSRLIDNSSATKSAFSAFSQIILPFSTTMYS
jgi:hypothetical protein